MTSEIAHCTPQLYWDVMCVCDYLLWSEPSIMSRLLHSRHFDEVLCVAMCSFFTFQISDFKKRLQLHLLLQLHIYDLLWPVPHFPIINFSHHSLPSCFSLYLFPFCAPPPFPLLPPTANFLLLFLLPRLQLSFCCGCMWVTFLFWLVSIKILLHVHSAHVCAHVHQVPAY